MTKNRHREPPRVEYGDDGDLKLDPALLNHGMASVDAVEAVVGNAVLRQYVFQRLGPAMGEAVPPAKVCRLSVENNVAKLDGQNYPLKEKQSKLLETLIQAAGEYVSGAELDIRTRDIENLPPAIYALVERQPGAGTRLGPGAFGVA